MDEEHSSIAGWVAGVFGVLLALVAFAREFFKHRHERTLKKEETTAKKEEKTLDVTSELAKSMLARIANLEQREETNRKEATQREDTLRVRLDAVEAEADECQQAQAVLREQHRVTLEEVCDLREENSTLRTRIHSLEGQNAALHSELNGLYRSIGVRRPASPPPPALPAGGRDVIEAEVTKKKE